MRATRNRPAARGFTLLEVLTVVAIFALLLSLMGVVAVRAREKARTSKCAALIKRIHVALDTYKAVWSDYPSGKPDDKTVRTWPDPYDPLGVELEREFINREGCDGEFTTADFDPKDDQHFIDPWGHHIRYRKVSSDRILIWSVGPNGIDEIGQDSAGRKERAGDDLSNVNVSY